MGLEIEGGGGSAGIEPTQNQVEEASAPKPPEAPAVSLATENGGAATAKAGDLKMSGEYSAFKLARQQPPTVTTAGSGIGTQATYQTGPPARPPIHHDNGFLQNPGNPNDPKPQPTRAPTWDERKAYAGQLAKADAALTAVQLGWPKGLTPDKFKQYLDLPDGIAAYHHFLAGNGADRQFSYEKFVKDDPSGKAVLNNATRDTQMGAQEIYRQMVAQDPSLAGKPVTFKMTGSQIGVGGSGSFPYPATENWQKAIGAHVIWNSADVTVTPPAKVGDPPQFSLRMTLHAEDRYNFNPGAADIATGQPDSDNGRFEVSGLAKQYMNYATLQRDVKWNGGNIAGSTKSQGVGR